VGQARVTVPVDEPREARCSHKSTEVNADESHIEAAREFLPKAAVLTAREAGAKAGFWLTRQNGSGVSVLVFDTEDASRAMAAPVEVGKPPMPDCASRVTVKTVDVREVIVSV
jgi:hypothetical protein